MDKRFGHRQLSCNKILLLARTSDISATKKPIDGLTFLYKLDREKIEVREIKKMGRAELIATRYLLII